MEEDGAKEMAKSILELELVCLIFNRSMAGYYWFRIRIRIQTLFDDDTGTIVRTVW